MTLRAAAPSQEGRARTSPPGGWDALQRAAVAAGPIALLLCVKAGCGDWAVARGFSHVSDDDYARVVIAERFAHAPLVDPSGTSWLPFPFWVHGAAMLAFGRSLGVALAVATVLGLASAAVGYAGMRAAGMGRGPAWLAAALAATTPWNAWLGLAPVPEAITGALVFFGAMTLVSATGARRAAPHGVGDAAPPAAGPSWSSSPTHAAWLGAGALFAASLSRYESWPVCAVFSAFTIASAARSERRARAVRLGAAALAAAGPLMWLAWNAHAHGAALHFLARVTTFHAAHAAELPLGERLLATPRALWTGAPELVVLGAVGALAGGRALLPFTRPLAATAGLLVFVAAGDVLGGAPTHHPERALLAVYWMLAAVGVRGIGELVRRHAWGRPKREAWGVAFAVMAAGMILAERDERLAAPPGSSAAEDRAELVVRGLLWRAWGVEGFTVTPCAYEHFALIAAFGAPERVRIAPPSGAGLKPACPTTTLP